MVKKTKKRTEKEVKKLVSVELLNKIGYLNILIEYSLKQLKKDGSVIDTIFKEQANRLYEDLRKLEEKQ